MVLEVSGGAVGVVSAETSGGGPLGHPVSSGPVSRLCGSQKSEFQVKLCKNLKVPRMGKLRTQLRARKGKGGPNLTTKISKSEIFESPKLAPERSWGIAGMAGRAEACSKDTAARPRASRTASSPA